MRNRQRNGGAGSRGSALPHRTRAFTLAEVLISLALIALLMAAAALGIHAANQSHIYSEKSDLLARARGVLDRIARDVRRAQSVAVPNDRSIVITMPDDSTRTYAWSGIAGGTITLTVTDGGTTSAVLTDDVQTFTMDDADQPTYSIHHGDAA